MPAAYPSTISSPGRAALSGALRFGLASLVVFATVAFGERWMYQNLGLYGAYLAWTALFILLGGAALRPLASTLKTSKFFLLFAASFFAYAVGWVGAYFTLRGSAGEWAGALAAALLMALVLCAFTGAWRQLAWIGALLFVAHSVGYFSGSALNNAIGGRAGMLLWGVAYGLGLGAGLGVALKRLDQERGLRR